MKFDVSRKLLNVLTNIYRVSIPKSFVSAPTVEKVIESANSYISISSDHVRLDFGIDDQRMHDNAIKLSLETRQACYIQKIKEEKKCLRVLAIGVAITKYYRVRNTTLSEKFLLKDGDRVSIPKSFVSKFDSIEQITDSITNGWFKNQDYDVDFVFIKFRSKRHTDHSSKHRSFAFHNVALNKSATQSSTQHQAWIQVLY